VFANLLTMVVPAKRSAAQYRNIDNWSAMAKVLAIHSLECASATIGGTARTAHTNGVPSTMEEFATCKVTVSRATCSALIF